MQPKNESYKTAVRQIFTQAPYIQALGIELVDVGEGWCESTLLVQSQHNQQDGFVHAGVQATMADHTAGAAAGSLVAAEQIVLTVEFKINLLRPCVGERLTCRAEVLRAGRQLTVVESGVRAWQKEQAKLVAKAMVTIAIVTPR